LSVLNDALMDESRDALTAFDGDDAINQGRARTISAHRDPDDTSDWIAVDFD